MALPLEHVVILDLTRLLPGAVCSMMLADLGAQVIKIEDPQAGDYARWTPPFLPNAHGEAQGAFFLASNRNKQSVVIDLKRPEGQAVLHRLVQQADVLLEGFRPSVTARLGADYATLSAINPRLIYCSLSGWGATGAYADLSGHDLNYVALSGLLGGMHSPQPLGGQIADVGGAYLGAMGILASLVKRASTGTGEHIDVALFESAMPFAMYQWVEALVAGVGAGTGSLTGGMAFYQVYTSQDGIPMAFAPIEPKFWQNFCAAVQRPDWIALHTDPSQQTTLSQALRQMFASQPFEHWRALLQNADCCWSAITPPEKTLDDPHIQARGMMKRMPDGVPYLRSPLHLSEAVPDYVPAPAQGEHTEQILAQMGYSAAEISALRTAGVVGK